MTGVTSWGYGCGFHIVEYDVQQEFIQKSPIISIGLKMQKKSSMEISIAILRDYQSVYSNYNNNHDYMNIRSDANVKERYTTISEGTFTLGQWIRRTIRDGNSVTE